MTAFRVYPPLLQALITGRIDLSAIKQVAIQPLRCAPRDLRDYDPVARPVYRRVRLTKRNPRLEFYRQPPPMEWTMGDTEQAWGVGVIDCASFCVLLTLQLYSIAAPREKVHLHFTSKTLLQFD